MASEVAPARGSSQLTYWKFWSNSRQVTSMWFKSTYRSAPSAAPEKSGGPVTVMSTPPSLPPKRPQPESEKANEQAKAIESATRRII